MEVLENYFTRFYFGNCVTSPYVMKFRDEVIPMWNVSTADKTTNENIKHMENVVEITKRYVDEAPTEEDKKELSKYVEGAEDVLGHFHDMACGS